MIKSILLVSLMACSLFYIGCKKSSAVSNPPVIDTVVALRPPNGPIPSISTFTLRDDGTVLLNGQPHFPLGYYGEGFDSGTDVLGQNKNLVTKLSEAGFNLTYTEYQVLGAQSNEFLDHCAAKGVYNVMNFYQQSASNDVFMTDFITRYKNKPSIMLWGVADDANSFNATDITRKHNLVKTIDSRLTYQSFYDGGAKLDATVGIVDASAMQSYPIFADGEMDRDWNKFLEIVSKCKFNKKASIANLQIYKWHQQPSYRFPTPSEVDVQSYLSIAAGFKGILYYTFRDYRVTPFSTIDITQPAIWKQTKQFAGEMSGGLLNAVLNGTHSAAKQGDGVYYGKWVYNNEEYVVAINARRTANSVFVPVSGTKANSIYGYRKATLNINSGALSGNLGPLEVQVYKVTN
jgi:hypothetical protein